MSINMVVRSPENSGSSRSGWWRVSLRAQGIAVLAVPLAALFAALFSIFWMEGAVHQADETVVLAYNVRGNLVDLRSSLLDAQNAITGYLSTSQPNYLIAYDSARQAVARILPRAMALLGSASPYAPALAEIQRLAADELTLLEKLRRQGPLHPETDTDRQRERAIMGDLQARVALLSEQHERLFTQARYERDQARARLFRTVLICGILGPLGALFIHLMMAGRMVRRLHAVEENARRLAHGLPLQPVPAGNDEIASLSNQLEDAASLLQVRESDIRMSERRYRELFDLAPIPFEETDLEGRVIRFNQAVCLLLKCTPDELLDRGVWSFMSPERQRETRESLQSHIREGKEPGPSTAECVLDDGTHLTLEIRENLVRNERGEITGVMRSLLDVTERNVADMAARKVREYAMQVRIRNDQLAQALETARSATIAKSRFLASVSHELRTPLNAIIGFSELLQDGKLGPMGEEQVDALGDILSSARHLLQLINDILDLSKVEAGRMDFHPEPCEIGALAAEVRDVIRPLAEKKSLYLTLDVEPHLNANLDPGRFKQVLYNYLSNAVKFTPESGHIALCIARQDERCFRLEVQDSGIGIRPDELHRLFQEFAQLPNSRQAEQGTGLGLALTRLIVEAQGGSVAVRSEPGRGSIFSAVLPLNSSSAIISKIES